MTKSERLLREIKVRNGMTHKEVVQFLLDTTYGQGTYLYNKDCRGYWSHSLYGDRHRYGLLEKYCEKNKNGKYKVVRKISGPFCTARRQFD